MATAISIEIFSDIVCPWCYIGKRRLDRALRSLSDDPDAGGIGNPTAFELEGVVEIPTLSHAALALFTLLLLAAAAALMRRQTVRQR